MKKMTQLQKIFSKIQVVRPPKHRLSTFGSTMIDYCLVTDVTGFTDRSRLRVGRVTSERPAIITPDVFKNRFQGFGDEAEQYAEWLISRYGKALRGLEYQFRNDTQSSRIDLTAPEKLTQKLAGDFDQKGEYRAALLRGPDKLWELSIMKFIVEETMASFSSNVQELNDRGFFDGEDRQVQRRHREIKNLIRKAREDRAAIPHLGKMLKDYGLFEQYQDEFFALVQS